MYIFTYEFFDLDTASSFAIDLMTASNMAVNRNQYVVTVFWDNGDASEAQAIRMAGSMIECKHLTGLRVRYIATGHKTTIETASY